MTEIKYKNKLITIVHLYLTMTHKEQKYPNNHRTSLSYHDRNKEQKYPNNVFILSTNTQLEPKTQERLEIIYFKEP